VAKKKVKKAKPSRRSKPAPARKANRAKQTASTRRRNTTADSQRVRRAASTKPAPARRVPPRSASANRNNQPLAVDFDDDDNVVVVDPDRPLPKSRLGRKELNEFRELLMNKRRELIGDVRNLTNEALKRNRQEASGDLSNMPIHMADIGTDNWEQEFTIGLLEQEKALVREIDEALNRISAGTYGICLATHKPITLARLRATPWAKYSIQYARMKERERFR